MERAAKKEKILSLRKYFKTNFNRENLPGEGSINMNVFLQQVRRKSQHVQSSARLGESQTLKGKITTSTMNVK